MEDIVYPDPFQTEMAAFLFWASFAVFALFVSAVVANLVLWWVKR